MKKYIFHIILLSLLPWFGYAQPYTACFTIAPGFDTIGCNSLTVQMLDCSGSPVIRYDFGDGLGFQSTNTHTYTSPGVYTVTQEVDDGSSSTDVTTRVNYIRVVIPQPPVYAIERCEGNIVRFNFSSSEHKNYSLVMGDGTIYPTITPPIIFSHTYPDNNPRNVIVQASYGSCGPPSEDTLITPLGAIEKPDISKVTVNNQSALGQVTLTFNALIDQQYYVQRMENGIGPYVNIDTLKNLTGIQNLVYKNLNTAGNRYCYRLISYDDCGSLPETSEEICSLIHTATASNNQNDLSWSAHIPGNVANYHIYRNGSLLASVPGIQTTYTDFAVNCGVDYCYQIVAELNQVDGLGNNLESVSAEQCVTGISTTIPTAIQNLNSTIVNGIPQVMWDTPVGFSVSEYHISRSVNGGAYSGYTNTTNNIFSDQSITIPGNTYCYTIDYTDNCGNNSVAGGNTCPIILDVAIDNTDNMLNHLSWTAYSGQWTGGIQEYQVEVLDEANNIINTFSAGLGVSYDDIVSANGIQVIRYRIKAIANGGPEVSYSNIVEIKYEGQIFIPNAFSPNGDNNNDIFLPKGQFIKEYNLTLYNRWGEVVYSTNQWGEGWDGNYLGSPATPDAYAYLIEISDLWGKVITKRGSVTLLR